MQSPNRKYKTLKDWRVAKGFTIRQAAAYLGVSLSSYYHLEAGHSIPRREAMERIALLTGVPKAVLAQVA